MSCNYYKLNHIEDDSGQYAKINETLNSNKYFIVYGDNQRLFASDLVLLQDSLKLNLQDLPPFVWQTYARVNEETKKYNSAKGGKDILNEIRIILNEGSTFSKGQQTLPLASIQRMDVVERASGKTTASYVFGAAGIVLATLVVASLLIALLKSSCPFVYTHDGEGYTLAGETFGGAIFAPVERDDYLPLPGFHPLDGNYKLKIENELKERQYINQAQLIMVQHSAESTVLMDRSGNIYTVSAPQAPLSAVTEEQKDYTKEMLKRDKHMFLFNEGNRDKVKSELMLTFYKEELADEGKLVLHLKNSLWLDYIYGEFTKLFGSYYNSWAEKQKTKSKEELNQWFFDQELPLKVFVKKNNAWEYVDYVNLIGPLAAARDVVVPIKHLADLKGEQIELKVESGFMFWELDYAALDLTPNEPVLVHRAQSSTALTNNGEDVTWLLAETDKQYLHQLQVGDRVELSYKALESSEKQVSVFLHTRGYYEHIRAYEGMPDLAELLAFKKPGKFTLFSKEKYLEYTGEVENWKDSKEKLTYVH